MSSSLLNAAEVAAGNTRNIVITFCNSAYGVVLENWLIGLKRLGVSNVLVCALDQPLARQLLSQGVPVAFTPCNPALSDIWAIRQGVIHDLLASGFNVLHCDVDAVWLKNPLPLIESFDADIISSQGTTHPNSCHKAWGHVLCYGFIQLRSNPRAIRLVQQSVAEAATCESFDDQRHLNEQLLACGMQWSARSVYQVPCRGGHFTCSPEPILGKNEELGLRVVLLPHAQIQRLPNKLEAAQDVFVRHPLSPKNAEKKEAVLRKNGCWFLPPN